MAGAFGYERQPQSPSPDPREVGRQLGQSQQMPMMPPPPVGGLELGEDPQGLARMGAERMSGAGQMGTGSAPPGAPDYDTDNEPPANINHAVGEALTRMAGGVMRGSASPVRAARRRAQLLKLGISSFEADLLSRSGGI